MHHRQKLERWTRSMDARIKSEHDGLWRGKMARSIPQSKPAQ
jgi:hypothetical protein